MLATEETLNTEHKQRENTVAPKTLISQPTVLYAQGYPFLMAFPNTQM